jgi:hypothetical protein
MRACDTASEKRKLEPRFLFNRIFEVNAVDILIREEFIDSMLHFTRICWDERLYFDKLFFE